MSDGAGPGTVVAVRMAVEDYGGTALGRRVEVVSADHANKLEVAVATTRKWFAQADVAMVTGLADPAVAIAVQGVAREMRRIGIVTASASSDLTGKACSPTGVHWVYDTYSVAA